MNGNTSSIDDEESRRSGINSIEKEEMSGGGRRFTMPVNIALDFIRNPYQSHQNDNINVNEINNFPSRPGTCGSDVLRISAEEIETSKNIFLSKNYGDIFHDYNKKLSKSSRLKQKKERKERGYLLDQFNKREFGNNYDETDRINISNKYGKKLWLRKSNKTEDLVTNRRKSSFLEAEFEPDKTSELFLTMTNSRKISRSPSFQFMKSGVNIINHEEREGVEKDEEREKKEVKEEMKEKDEDGDNRNYHRKSTSSHRLKRTESDQGYMRQRIQSLKAGKSAGSRSAHFRNLGLKSADLESFDSRGLEGNNNNNQKDNNDNNDNNDVNCNNDNNNKILNRDNNNKYNRKLSFPSPVRPMIAKKIYHAMRADYYNDEEKERKKDTNKFINENNDFSKISDFSLSLESEIETLLLLAILLLILLSLSLFSIIPNFPEFVYGNKTVDFALFS